VATLLGSDVLVYHRCLLGIPVNPLVVTASLLDIGAGNLNGHNAPTIVPCEYWLGMDAWPGTPEYEAEYRTVITVWDDVARNVVGASAPDIALMALEQLKERLPGRPIVARTPWWEVQVKKVLLENSGLLS